MAILIILICALLSCTKVTIQGYLSKGNIKNTTDSVLANCLVFAFTFIIFSLSLKNGINLSVVCYSIWFGVLSVSFQVFYALALKAGPFSASCMLINLNMVVPVIFSIIYYNETATITKVIGIILCLTALFLNIKNDGKKVNIKWFAYVVLAFVSTGGISIVQKIFAKSEHADCLEQFIFFGYLIAFLLSAVIFFTQQKFGSKTSFKLNRKNILLVFLIAAALGGFQFFNTYGNSFIDAIILVPSVSGMATVFQMLSGRIIFRERFTKRQICSILVGVTAILLISL